MGRRIIRLMTNGAGWRVEAAQGNNDAQFWQREYRSEWEARAIITALIERTTNAGEEWRDTGGD